MFWTDYVLPFTYIVGLFALLIWLAVLIIDVDDLFWIPFILVLIFGVSGAMYWYDNIYHDQSDVTVYYYNSGEQS